MRCFNEWFQTVTAEVAEDFYAGLAKLPRSRRVFDMLSAGELAHLKHRLAGHLSALAGSDMRAGQLEAASRHVGKVHAVVGVDRDELVIGKRLIIASVKQRMVQAGYHDESERGFAQTLTDDLTWQLQGFQALEDARQDVLQRITRAVCGAGGYTDLINEVVAILAVHEPITGCAIGRPDQDGVFHFEAATRNMNSYFADLISDEASNIVVHADKAGGQGPVGRAWRSRQIERILNFSTDAQATPWRELALARGVRSCIAIPLGADGEQPLAVLVAYSALPGGFISTQQSAFFDMVQTLLGGALARLDEVDGMRVTFPFTIRSHLAALVRSDALVTYYQPLMDLHTCTITKVEALARLRDGDRLLGPGQFLGGLNGDDLFEVFSRGLNHALAARRRWLDAGVELDISINLPPAGLSDVRYVEATAAALEAHGCQAEHLTLEVLENEAVSLTYGRKALLERLRALGVKLAQDDLGAGQSGLARLRELPFDLVKIDRGMITFDGQDPMPTLTFVHQLTRLGHALGKHIVAEGVESQDLLAALCILGVDLVQGYVIARPLPEAELIAMMTSEQHKPRRAVMGTGALTRLARLIVWRDRLDLNASLPAFNGARQGNGTLRDEILRELTMLHGFKPRTPDEARLQLALENAARTTGPRGDAFEHAYGELIRETLRHP